MFPAYQTVVGWNGERGIVEVGRPARVAAILIALIFVQHQLVEKNRAHSDRMRGEIEDGRALVMITPDLEREVKDGIEAIQ